MALLKQITSRVRSYRYIRSAIEVHGKRIVEYLEKRVNPHVPEKMRVDFWAYLQSILEVLRQACDQLLVRENHLLGERANDTEKRLDRDHGTAVLSRAMQRFRNAFQSNYEPPNIEAFGFPVESSTIPLEVLRQSDHLVDRLTHPEVKIPEPTIGSGLPVLDLATEVDGLAKQLRACLDTTDDEGRHAEAAVIDKDRAVVDWDEKLPWAARSLSGLFSMAGEKELAARILPSPRRPGRIVQVDDEEDQEEGQGGSGTGGPPPGPPEPEPPGAGPAPGAGGGTTTG